MTVLNALAKIRKVPSYVRDRGVRAAARRAAYVVRSGELFREQWVGYETPAWPVNETEYRSLAAGVSVQFHCDFPSLSGVSIHVRTSRRARLSLVLVDVSGTEIRRCSIHCPRAARDYFACFRFRLLSASDGKDFTVSLACVPAEAASVAVNHHHSTRSLHAAEGIPECRFYCSDRLLSQYDLWIRRNEPSAAMLHELRTHDLSEGPVVSIVVPVYETPLNVLDAMVASVVDQTWPWWELCIANAGSSGESVGQALDQWATKDKRIHVVHLGENRGIAGNTNAALGLATGTYVALLDHDDTLAQFALSSIVRAIAEQGQPDMIYSDYDKLDAGSGRRMDPFFKPAWSPHLLMSINCIAHFLCIRKELVDAVGGLRSEFDGSQDYDLTLRCSERARQIVHIPEVLYHWRVSPSSTAGSGRAKLYAFDAGRKALAEHLGRVNIAGEVVSGQLLGHYETNLELPEDLTVSVIMSSRGHSQFLARAVTSCLQAVPGVFEVLVLDNGGKRPETLSQYRHIEHIDKVHVLNYSTGLSSWPLANNGGAAQARGDVLVFLDDGLQARSRTWLRAMVQWLADPAVGAVGARLLRSDGRILHAGMVLGMYGLAGSRCGGASEAEEAALDATSVDVRDVTAVSGRCLLVRRRAFEQVCGFDEALPSTLGDIDLCLRLRKSGYQIVYTPHATLVDDGLEGRDSDICPAHLPGILEASSLMWRRWGPDLDSDPFHSPNQTLNASLPRIRMT